jgi:hypothetical protein
MRICCREVPFGGPPLAPKAMGERGPHHPFATVPPRREGSFGNPPRPPKAMGERDLPALLAHRLVGWNSKCSPQAASKLAHKTKTGSNIDAAFPRLRREFRRLGADLRSGDREVPHKPIISRMRARGPAEQAESTETERFKETTDPLLSAREAGARAEIPFFHHL